MEKSVIVLKFYRYDGDYTLYKKRRNINHKGIFRWGLVFIWMLVIFILSAQKSTDSDSLSSGITRFVLNIINDLLPQIEIEFSAFSHFVRKSAHFIAYLILGILSMYAIDEEKNSKFAWFTKALLICVLYAMSDEFHQRYVPGRSGELKDVLLDSTGSLVGILGYVLVRFQAIKHAENKRRIFK